MGTRGGLAIPKARDRAESGVRRGLLWMRSGRHQQKPRQSGGVLVIAAESVQAAAACCFLRRATKPITPSPATSIA